MVTGISNILKRLLSSKGFFKRSNHSASRSPSCSAGYNWVSKIQPHVSGMHNDRGLMPNGIKARFLVAPGKSAKLHERDPADLECFPDRDIAQKQSQNDAEEIDKLQDRLYAESKRAVLVVLQGIDTAGKDGTIRRVFKEVGPLGVIVTPFRRPSEDELAHDFLWRAHRAAPRRGFVGVFNRSHYEDVLVALVRQLAPKNEIESRYGQINAFEKILAENGTTILKFMLHISKEEQAKRLKKRLEEPKSRWKFDPNDLEDRKLWNEYALAYEIMLGKCSTEWAPWYVIPSDHKWARNAAIASIVRTALEEMNPRYPKPSWDSAKFSIE
jgi:PPK2 family polyphosphate:nucleotide phosphotransferase